MIVLNQKGSAMILSLFVFTFLAIIIPSILYMTNTQLMSTVSNNDTIEAQYAAEAGIKRAIVGIQNERTDWEWADGKIKNNFANDTDKKYYIVSITPVPNINDNPSNVTYTITSNGYVNNAHKKVTATITKTKAPSGPFSYATFSKNNLLINNPQINGDVYSNGNITVNSSTKNTVTGTAYCKDNNYTIYTTTAVGNGFKTPDTNVNLDIGNIMIPIPDITKSGTDLQAFINNKSGSFTLSDKSYLYNSDYGMYNQSYSIVNGNSVIIYVNGNFDIGKDITGGNITIYATGNITFNGGSVQASPGGSVKIYTDKTLTLNKNSSITGSAVTVVASTAIAFNGGSINSTLENSVSKIYTGGDVALNDTSVIAGKGIGMLVSLGNVGLNGGTAINTIIIAGKNVDGNNNSKVAGIYSNGSVNMNGASITYNDTLAHSLNLYLTTTTSKLVVLWGK